MLCETDFQHFTSDKCWQVQMDFWKGDERKDIFQKPTDFLRRFEGTSQVLDKSKCGKCDSSSFTPRRRFPDVVLLVFSSDPLPPTNQGATSQSNLVYFPFFLQLSAENHIFSQSHLLWDKKLFLQSLVCLVDLSLSPKGPQHAVAAIRFVRKHLPCIRFWRTKCANSSHSAGRISGKWRGLTGSMKVVFFHRWNCCEVQNCFYSKCPYRVHCNFRVVKVLEALVFSCQLLITFVDTWLDVCLGPLQCVYSFKTRTLVQSLGVCGKCWPRNASPQRSTARGPTLGWDLTSSKNVRGKSQWNQLVSTFHWLNIDPIRHGFVRAWST